VARIRRGSLAAAPLVGECESNMWIFEPEMGFLSVVCARKGHGEPGQPLDVDRVMIRARNVRHLDTLRDRHEALRAAEILETPLADYPARIIVAKEVWVSVLVEIAAEADYGNFKAASSRGACVGDTALNGALHDIWARMVRYQRETERGSG